MGVNLLYELVERCGGKEGGDSVRQGAVYTVVVKGRLLGPTNRSARVRGKEHKRKARGWILALQRENLGG